MDFRRFSLVLGGALLLLAGGAAAGWCAAPSGRAVSPVRRAGPARTQTLDQARRIDVNNINMWATNFGSYAWDIGTGNAGLVYPKGTQKTAVFAAGLWVGAQVSGDTRCAVAEYSMEYVPGPMRGGTYESDSSQFHVYKVVRWSGDHNDTAHVEDPTRTSSDPQADALVHHSWSEYMNGAAPYGAPVRTWRLPSPTTPGDSVDVVGPDVSGDMMLWSVYNDAKASQHINDAGSTAPLGIEVQHTLFAFNRQGALSNTLFSKWKIINKGGNRLDNTFVSLWADPDLGGSTDDLVGCDTTRVLNTKTGKLISRSLGFIYNANNNDQLYAGQPPAVGWDFLLGPRGDAGDTLGMVSFNKYINGTDPHSFDETYCYMQGLQPDCSPLTDNHGVVTTFFHAGDPVTGTGWIDPAGADKRLMLSSGPFTMQPGDTQNVVAAVIIGQGNSRLSSISSLRFFDTFAKAAFNVDFNLPSPPPAPKVTAVASHDTVTLCWDSASRLNYNEPGYKFEGYNVYQGESVSGPWHLIQTYDEVDTFLVVFDQVFDPITGQLIPQFPTAFGSNTGISFCHTITQDAIRGGNLRDAQQYYFAVTAYSVNPEGVPKVLENSQSPIRVIPQRAPAGTDVATASATPVTYTQLDTSKPPSTDVVRVEVMNPAEVTGHEYKVAFVPLDPPVFGQVGADTATARYAWDLIDVTTGDTLLKNQINQRGDTDYRIVQGLRVTVQGAYFPQLQSASYLNLNEAHRRPITGVNWSGNQDWFFGGAGYLNDFFGSTLDPAAMPDSFTTVRLDFSPGDTTGQQYGYEYQRRELGDSTSVGNVGDPPPGGRRYAYGGFHKVPFKAFDAVKNQQINVAWVEAVATDSTGAVLPQSDPRQLPTHDDTWYPFPDPSGAAREYLFILRSAYSPTPLSQYEVDGLPTAGALDGLYALWPALRDSADVIDKGDAFEFVWAVPASPNDVYTFSTKTLKRGNAGLARVNLNRIRVVPNPYYGRSRYELSQFARVMRFTNLPEAATIRIFNLGGDLVRTLRKTDPTSSVLDWDLKTENRLPVASGVYIYHVDVPGVGSTFGRLVVFMEKERLNTL